MAAEIIRREIKGTPYVLTRNRWGWQITRVARDCVQFTRTYQVYCLPSGAPQRCDCPDCTERLNWCKHLRAAEEVHHAKPEVNAALVAEAFKCCCPVPF